MSYILDSLKKLEKEKAKFDDKLDLKKLLIKDNSESQTIKALRKRSHFLTFLILGISVFFFANFYIFKLSPPASNSSTDKKSQKEEKAASKLEAVSVKKTDEIPPTILEPPAKAVQENPKSLPEDTGNVLKSNSPQQADKKFVELASSKVETNQEVKEAIKTDPVPMGLSDADVDQRLNRIEQLIQQEYIPGEVSKIEEEDKKLEKAINKHQREAAPARLVLRSNLPPDIQDLKVNGIVFFGEGNPLNYAMASFRGDSQIKLKEGDRLETIGVLEIKSEKLILIFEKQVYEKSLGN